RAVVLLSGGLDSATCLAVARRDGFSAHALSVDYGQRHRAELLAARRVASALGAASHRVVAVDLRALGGSALTSEAIEVRKRGVEGRPVEFRAPLLSETKAGIARLALALRVPVELTLSCYDPPPPSGDDDVRAVHCGRCDACRLRRRGFQQAGLMDPTAYAG